MGITSAAYRPASGDNDARRRAPNALSAGGPVQSVRRHSRQALRASLPLLDKALQVRLAHPPAHSPAAWLKRRKPPFLNPIANGVLGHLEPLRDFGGS